MKKTPLIGLIVLVAMGSIAIAGYLGQRSAQPTQVAELQKPITVPVTRGDVQRTVLAPGMLVNTRRAELSFDVSGKLARVLVRPGDVVHTGDALALLERTELEVSAKQAELEMAIAQARLAQLLHTPADYEVASAEAALESARAACEQLLSGPTEEEIALAEAELKRAEASLRQAQSAYDQVRDRPDIGMLPQSLQLQQATLTHEAAQARHRQVTRGASEAEKAAARAQVRQAQAALERLRAGASEEEIAIAQAQIEQAQASLEQARKRLEATVITAPFDGVVVEVRGAPGSTVSAGEPVIVLIDPQALEVEATLVEEDVPLVQSGLPVECFFDARPDDAFAARVDRLVPQRRSGGRPLYTLYIALDEEADLHSLLPGMTVDASIVLDRRSDVLILPRTLVRIRSDGTARVDVWNGVEIENRTIRVGLRGDLYVEVLEGLSEGDEAVQR